MRILTAMSFVVLMVTSTAMAAPATITLPGDQEPVISHIGGRVQAGTAMARTHAGTAIISTTATYQWPGTYIEGAFEGDQVYVRLNDSANTLNIYIDGKLKEALNRPGGVLKAYKGLGSGQHIVRVERMSETQGSTGTFAGFFAPKGKGRVIHPRALQIEYIGDSYTVGYGNMSPKRQCTPEELHTTTDTQNAYGPLTARHFNADYQVNAFSGRGIVRNYDGFNGDPLPALHPYILFDKATEYRDESWKPQVIVIGLGGNDFSTPVKPGEPWADEAALKADYEKSFVAFVKILRGKHPQAYFLLTKYEGPVVAAEVEKVAATLKADGETRLDTIGLDGFNLMGCDWHLDAGDDKRISQQLIGYFDAHPELWQGK